MKEADPMSDKKTVVVVGAGPGVGLAVARRFGREGMRVALVARRAEALTAHCEELAKGGAEARGYAADVSDFAALDAALGRIDQELGAPEVLVYNAAVLKPGQPSSTSPDSLIADFRVNVAAALASAQHVIPAMRERGRGTILFTGGGLALEPYPAYASLAVGKAAMRNLCFSLAAELGPQGIHVATVTICGFVKPGTHFDPDKIAEAYWTLYIQEGGAREREIVYK